MILVRLQRVRATQSGSTISLRAPSLLLFRSRLSAPLGLGAHVTHSFDDFASLRFDTVL